jgi:uncharacterized protein with ParB-like and HNH nuclease domain/predicted transport protein
MKASAKNLLTIIKEPKQFVIPIYQRTYSWQKKQCKQLLTDILNFKQNEGQGHFIGSIVYFQPSIHTIAEVPEYLVIDGQQRLTTVSLLISAIAKYLEEHKDVKIDTTVKKLNNYYLFNVEEEGELFYKLVLTQRDKKTFTHLISNKPLSEKSSIRIIENFNYFYSQITKENISNIYSGIQHLFVVDVALEKDKDNPQLIFESLNSTGLDLSQADLIRNYVLMGQPNDIQTKLHEHYWYPMEQSFGDKLDWLKWFIRDYLTMKMGAIPKIELVYETYKNFLKSNNAPSGIEDAVRDLFIFSKYYVRMALHKEPNPKLLSVFKDISRLKVDVSYPFFLAVYNDFDNGLITEGEFIEIIKFVESYVFRRAICGIPTNSLNKTFATFYKYVFKNNYLNSVKAHFVLMDGYRRFPTDTDFKNEIVNKDVYNFRSRNYLLDKLENYGRKEPINIENYTIEHIMPQTITSKWQVELGENWESIFEKYLHTIGNITLTGYNPDMSNKSFREKKNHEKGFRNSPLFLNEYIRHAEIWNEISINERAQKLSIKASQIWAYPSIAVNELELFKQKPEKEKVEYTLENYEYLQNDIMYLYQVLRKRILNIDAIVKEEHKKLYIAFKAHTNFVDIVPQKSRLRLSLNIEFENIIDPKGICKDITDLGRWGNGDVEVGLSEISEIDYIMELINQAFDEQIN